VIAFVEQLKTASDSRLYALRGIDSEVVSSLPVNVCLPIDVLIRYEYGPLLYVQVIKSQCDFLKHILQKNLMKDRNELAAI